MFLSNLPVVRSANIAVVWFVINIVDTFIVGPCIDQIMFNATSALEMETCLVGLLSCLVLSWGY